MKTINHEPNLKQAALAAYLEAESADTSPSDYGHYGLDIFKFGEKQYAIGTDKEANAAAREYIEGSIWAFNASFILSECGLPGELEDCIKSFQEKECESANKALLALVNKCGDLDSFVESAISSDGRGHFLSGYDGEENDFEFEGETYYIYRVN